MTIEAVDTTTAIDQDTPWKSVLDNYLSGFLHLCYPHIAERIDWQQECVSLDKELSKINKDAALGNRILDKLFRVTLKSGEKALILLHLEVQGRKEKIFPKRMFIYRYRLFDRYHLPVISIAILTDKNHKWRPDRFIEKTFDCWVGMQFYIVKILDYRGQEEALKQSSNPFCLVILAQLAAMQRYPDAYQKLATKKQLTRLLYERKWSKERIITLFTVIDYLLALPEPLEIVYNEYLHELEETQPVAYMTTPERIGLKKGIEQGVLLGIQKGMQQGMREGEHTIFLRQLRRKFGIIPAHYLALLAQADEKTLLTWAELFVDAQTLEEIFGD